jgi:hypothetical protein
VILPAKSAPLARGNDLSSAARQVFNRARGSAMSSNAKRISTFDLKQIGEAVDGSGNFRVMDRHWAIHGLSSNHA